jgi:pimeloyl-ACP methyl ester carboxylesterase
VLLAAVTPHLLKTPDNPDGTDRSVFDQMVEGLNKDRPHFLARFGKTFFGAGLLTFSVSGEILQWTQGLALQASPKAIIDCARAFSATDFRSDMPAVTMPTLIVHGTSDQTVPIDGSARAAARLIRGARLVEYDGASHALFVTEKERLNGDLLAFIRG